MTKFKFVRFGLLDINPHAVTFVTEIDKAVYVHLISGHAVTIQKHEGEILVNDRKAVVSALEAGMKKDDADD